MSLIMTLALSAIAATLTGNYLPQGADAALATALLGAFCGFVYRRRRPMVAPIVIRSSSSSSR